MNELKAQRLITSDTLNQAYDYAQYRQMIDDLLAEGKTTDPNQSEGLTNYTKMNVQRMSRWDKTAALNESLKAVLAEIKKELYCLPSGVYSHE